MRASFSVFIERLLSAEKQQSKSKFACLCTMMKLHNRRGLYGLAYKNREDSQGGEIQSVLDSGKCTPSPNSTLSPERNSNHMCINKNDE